MKTTLCTHALMRSCAFLFLKILALDDQWRSSRLATVRTNRVLSKHQARTVLYINWYRNWLMTHRMLNKHKARSVIHTSPQWLCGNMPTLDMGSVESLPRPVWPSKAGMLPRSHCDGEEVGCIGLSSWLHYVCIMFLLMYVLCMYYANNVLTLAMFELHHWPFITVMSPQSHCCDKEDGRIGSSLWLHYVCITLLDLCLLNTQYVMNHFLYLCLY